MVEIESRNMSSALQLNELGWGRDRNTCKHVNMGNKLKQFKWLKVSHALKSVVPNKFEGFVVCYNHKITLF